MRFERPALAVVKVGSSSLRRADGQLDRERIAVLSAQIAAARDAGTRMVVVSSGAVAAGMGRLGIEQRPTDLPTLQACAAVGQGDLIHEYQARLDDHGASGAQILLSQDDFVRRHRYLNARTTMRRLLQLGTVPVINENDAVATEELAYGDNDHLAALVASMLEADLLLLLSDVDGLYDKDPRQHPDAELVAHVARIDDLDLDRIGGTGSFVGSGGMRTKVESARVAVASAAHAVVANAGHPDVVTEVMAGREVGTWFQAQQRRLEARRLWIGFALNPHGTVAIDDGAARAILERGTSLLAVGVTSVDGSFEAGDAVEVVDGTGATIARGLVNYDVSDLRRIAGLTTEQAAEQLGPAYAREVIHRDDLALLAGSGDGGN
ncbi:MAG: glutamate 5-kinase [Nitriliruptorales bacterium]|nr:glutamate 5-kinase [Nitriliruptorales bacterium]